MAHRLSVQKCEGNDPEPIVVDSDKLELDR